jgi:hypothetical protein
MKVKINLLDETIEALLRYEKNPEDVLWVGNYDEWETWENFANSAKNFEYDPESEIVEVDTCLKIVGDDWWLEREEYEGSEWWEFKSLPDRPEEEVSNLKLRFGRN